MRVSLLGVGLLALSTTIGFAQTVPAQARQNAPTINQRRAHQQERIGQGIRNHHINASKAVRLEKREASIGRQEDRMRATNGGRLTKVDRVRLNHRLNRTSHAIYRAKHGAAKRHGSLKQ